MKKFYSTYILIITFSLVLYLTGCISVNYIGKNFEATNKIEIFYSEKEIKNEYQIIGHALGKGGKYEKIQNGLLEKAKEKGADALLILGIDSDMVTINETPTNQNKIHASFIKYN